MRQRYRIAMAVVVVLSLGLLATSLVMATNSTTPRKYLSPSKVNLPIDITDDLEKLKTMIPKTYEEVEAQIYPPRGRFLMWTHDGTHIMWGRYGKNYFIGTDDLGKRCWGIYGRGIFAGIYDGDFFWGRYNNGLWKAKYLFGLEESHGRYVLFPVVSTTVVDSVRP